MGQCLDTDELAAMIAGELAGDRIEAVVVHVDACRSCAEVVAGLGQLEDSARGVGRYQLGHVLGAGAMGIVYEAWDPQLKRRVAIKLVRPERADEVARERMLREAQALARISHPNVIAIYDVAEHDGDICVATELVEGETLATWCTDRSRREILDAWLQAARGLAAAHAGGVVHRDIKPANVLVGRDGRVRVGDFGLAALHAEPAPAAAGSGDRLASCVAGTPAYMAPEQREGRLDARSDQYSLCVGIAESLGATPEADAVPAVEPPALRELLARGLRADPEQRFPTMLALTSELERAVAPPPHRRWPFMLAGAAAAIALGTGAVLLLREHGPPCEAATVPEAVWSPARRAAVARLHPTLAARVDSWLAAWAEASADVCVTDRDDAALAARRRRCLDEQLGDLARAVDQLRPGANIADAHDQLESVALPALCAHAVVAGARDPTLVQRLEYARIRVALRHDPARDQLAQLLERTRALGFAPYAADVAGELGILESNVATPADAARTFRDGMAYADAHGDDLGWTILAADLMANLQGDTTEDVDALAAATRTRIAKLGGVRELEAELEIELSRALDARGRRADALEAAASAVASFRVRYGSTSLHVAYALHRLASLYFSRDPDSVQGMKAWLESTDIFHRLGTEDPRPPLPATGDAKARVAQYQRYVAGVRAQSPESVNVVDGEWGLGLAYILAGDDPAALAAFQRAIAIADHLKLRTDHVAHALSQAAGILNEQGHPREALPLAERAVAIAEEVHADDTLAAALNGYGNSLLEIGDLARAREVLARGVDLRERIHDPPKLRARTRFLYAKATWPVDHAHGVRLAAAAREDMQLHLDSLTGDDDVTVMLRREARDAIDRMDAWLRAHRR